MAPNPNQKALSLIRNVAMQSDEAMDTSQPIGRVQSDAGGVNGSIWHDPYAPKLVLK